MKKLLFAFMALSLFACSSDDDQKKPLYECDNVFDGDIQLSSQAEVNAFAAKGYCEINGRLQIGTYDNAQSDIVNIDALLSLKGVEILIIENNPNLTNLNGLGNLVLVSHGISIRENDALTNLQGLNSLTIVGNLTIMDMPSLTTLRGLDNVSIIIALNIYNNPELSSIDVLKNISAPKNFDAMDKIAIVACPRITSLPDFKNITKAGDVYITDNASLTSLEGLHHIKNILKDLVIANNPSLESIEGLRGITRFDEYFSPNTLTIENNVMLPSLNGLENIKSFHGYLNVSGNYLLNDFCAISHMVTTEQGFDVYYGANNNFYNPELEDFQAGNCSRMF